MQQYEVTKPEKRFKHKPVPIDSGLPDLSESPILPYFGLNSASDGVYNPVTTLEGQSGDLTEGMMFDQSNQFVYPSIDQFVPGENGITAFVALNVKVYPNPFRDNVQIAYELQNPGMVELSVYNLFGERMGILVSYDQQTGRHQVQWNEERLPAGVYFYRLVAGNHSANGKIVAVR